MLDAGDQLWLNRHLLEAAFRQATGHACFRRLNSGLDGVLVSDVGKPFEVQSNRRAGGLIRTALRATDILMDRVWQLENETFQDTPGFVFAPITEVVEPAEDPTALHPEIQRQAANIRTDLDRFSPLEISSLVRHGYCVGRKACRAHPDLFGADLPGNAPWDPIPAPRGAAPPVAVAMPGRGPSREPVAATVEARTLQASALRRIWSTLLDYRDWVSYVYVPLLVPILFLLPYFVVKSYQRSQRVNHLIESLSQGSRDLEDEPAARRQTASPGPASPPRKFAASTSRTSRVSRSSRTRASLTCAAGSQASRGERCQFPGLWLSAVEGPQTAGEHRKQPLPRPPPRDQSQNGSPVPTAAASAQAAHESRGGRDLRPRKSVTGSEL